MFYPLTSTYVSSWQPGGPGWTLEFLDCLELLTGMCGTRGSGPQTPTVFSHPLPHPIPQGPLCPCMFVHSLLQISVPRAPLGQVDLRKGLGKTRKWTQNHLDRASQGLGGWCMV